MKTKMSLIDVLIIHFLGILLGGLLVLAIVYSDLREYGNLKARISARNKVELSHSGGGCLYYPPNWDVEKDGKYFGYNLRSWDGGNTWYSVKKVDVNGQWGYTIDGSVDELYPGLLEYIEGMDNLTNYVRENGPISLSSQKGVETLEDAGFTVTKQ